MSKHVAIRLLAGVAILAGVAFAYLALAGDDAKPTVKNTLDHSTLDLSGGKAI